jgi:hypothetical protein
MGATAQQRSLASTATAAEANRNFRKDGNGLWWRGDDEADGPYVLNVETSMPPLAQLSSESCALPDFTAGDFKKIPFTAAEILPIARELAINCNVAALSTIAELTPESGKLFPRSRSVSTRHYINEDFTEVSIATKLFTRKVEELSQNPNFSLLWKYESDEMKTTGGWILAIGEAKVVPHPNAGKGPEVDGHDKAKIVFSINRLEIQDYPNNILAFGHDKWRCCILERQGHEWLKVR